MKKVIDGCAAVADIAYRFSEVASIYPITPASPMASGIDEYRTLKKKNLFSSSVEVIEMQSEAGAAGTMHGALLAGSLASTFTASQGLLLMIPNMYKMAGEGLPGVIHVASRTIATHALSIFGDHSDVYAARDTGFCMLSSASVQEAHDLAAVAHLSAISASMPFLHFMDGFRTSHEINRIELLSDDDLIKLLDMEAVAKFKEKSLNINEPKSRGMAENEDIYFQSLEARNRDYDFALEKIVHYMNKINDIRKTDYKPFNYYGAEDAKYLIIAMGSVTSTIKVVVDELIEKGESVGLITVHLYRPFSSKHLLEVLPKSTRKIAVLDRAKSSGAVGEPLYLDVSAVLRDMNVDICGGRYGLSSKNTTPSDIMAVYDMLMNKPKKEFTIGIDDDVTHLSLAPVKLDVRSKMKEMVVYGYGSDGMVSACKDILKIMGDVKDEYVQGYFEYDSKKSGGVTISHMRFNSSFIDLPYYPEHPNIIIVTKDIYMNKFHITENLSSNGALLINTKLPFAELNVLPEILKDIVEKNITVFTIDAGEIAERNDLKGKISLIFETIALKLLGVDDYHDILCERLQKRFETKGESIVQANIRCVKEAIAGLVPFKGEIEVPKIVSKKRDVIDAIEHRRGGNVPVSLVVEFKNGIFPAGLSKLEKRAVSDRVPVWKSDNCIECGMCSFVCPHAVIRPFVVDKDEKFAEDGIALLGGEENDKYRFIISVSEADCTGCGACIEVCPGKGGEKALKFGETDPRRQRLANTLFNFYNNPKLYDKYTIKGSQLESPKFEFSGACAGCGETPYIKLLTQLFGDRLIIANATGCSSIYGGSVPSTPYSVPWANSLFEDNAEFGYGIYKGYEAIRERLAKIMEDSLDTVNEPVKELFNMWLSNRDDYEITHKVAVELHDEVIPKEIKDLKDYLEAPSIWTIGGDGWAYDIGFSGIDHVLSSGENVNILVLDTEVYSNTGGQASKASHMGQVAEFANSGKKTYKKDLFRIAMSYPDVYVASVAMGANMFQTLKAFKEAEEHKGPSIIIAYSPCVEQGIKKGMSCSVLEAKNAVECGYTILMRYKDEQLTVDSKEPDFTKYEKFLDGEIRYNALKIKNPKRAEKLVTLECDYAKKRYSFYKDLEKK